MREFAFKLALVMGEVDVDAMLESISLPMLLQWMQYYSDHGFGDDLANIRQGITSWVIASVNRGKGQRPYRLEDFIPGQKKRQPPPERVVDDWKRFVALHNANIGKGNGKAS